jgi:hypothetical protein
MLERGLTEDGAAQALGWPKHGVTARVKIFELPERAQQLVGEGTTPGRRWASCALSATLAMKLLGVEVPRWAPSGRTPARGIATAGGFSADRDRAEQLTRGQALPAPDPPAAGELIRRPRARRCLIYATLQLCDAIGASGAHSGLLRATAVLRERSRTRRSFQRPAGTRRARLAGLESREAVSMRVLERIFRGRGGRGRIAGRSSTTAVTASRLVAVAVVEEHHGAAPDRQEVQGMCEEWWMWRRRREAEEARRLWDEFERTRPVTEPGPVTEPERMDEREVTLEEREATASAAES